MATKSWGNVRQLSNHARVLRYIFRNQPVSRSEIGQDLNLPRSMVTGITARLIEQDIVRELGKADTQEDGAPGRRRQLLGIRPDARFAVGAEIGVRHFRFCLTDLAGHVLEELCYAPTEEQIRRVNETLCLGVRQLLDRRPELGGRVVGVGIALPGHLNAQTGGMVSHAPQWDACAPSPTGWTSPSRRKTTSAPWPMSATCSTYSPARRISSFCTWGRASSAPNSRAAC